MTLDETAKLLHTIRLAYPDYSYSDATVSQWHEVLDHAEFLTIKSNLYDFIRRYPYHPGLNDIAVFKHREPKRLVH